MRIRILAAALMLVSLVAPSLPLRAEEGMWLPDTVNKLPLAKMKAKGFTLKPEEVFSTTAPSLKDAIVIVDGGTGELISADGLLLTNHHVAFEGLAEASTPEKDYLTHGFTAKSRAEEIPAKGYTCQVLLDSKDVTAEVLSAVKDDMSAQDRLKAIEAKQKELNEAAQKDKKVTCRISEMLNGLSYYQYTYETYKDVRLVYAPPKSIGFFGGDDDNFQWPRHTGDFTFLRVYSGPDGSPAEFSDKNVPYHPKRFLSISMEGYKEGDFVMIMGYPGRTTRYREASSIALNYEVQLPFIVELFNSQIELLREAGRKDKKLELELAPTIFGLSNSAKNYEGTLKGLRRANLMERRQAEETEFTKFLETKPELKAKYGEVIPRLDKLNQKLREHFVSDRLISGVSGTGFPGIGILSMVSAAMMRALDQEKPAAERSPRFSDAVMKGMQQRIPAMFQEHQPKIERKTLEMIFKMASDLPDDKKIPLFEKYFGGKTPEARRAGESEFARQMIESPYWQNAESLSKLFEMSADQFRAQNDPTLQMMMEVVKELPAIEKRAAHYNAEVSKLRPLYIEGMTAFRHTTIYPDANRTLRFTYGEVKGYKPFDGAFYNYVTTLGGVIDKDTGREPFDVPSELKELAKKHDYGTYADPKLNDVPVAFLATTDITGGNSGSPIMNGRGEMIGIAFDGNYEGLGSDYVFNPDLARTISVDVRYVMFLADKMGGANYLFKELKFAGKAAAAKK